MEHLLRHLAEQLDSLDEASLMNLWEKYARRTHEYALTRDWELDVLVYCLIQAKHMKNQLFNYCLAHRDELPPKSSRTEPAPADVAGLWQGAPAGKVPPTFARGLGEIRESMGKRADMADKNRQPCAVLRFNPDAGRK